MFSKAKRFEEIKTRAPSPGHYDLSRGENGKRGVSFSKLERFSEDQPNEPDICGNEQVKPLKLHSSFEKSSEAPPSAVKPKSSRLSVKSSGQPDKSLCVEHEKEIKCLLAERSSHLKQLQSKEQELTKVDGRLQAALKDKSALHTKVALLENDLKSLCKAKELLESKLAVPNTRLQDAEVELSRLKKEMQRKEEELSQFKTDMECKQNDLITNIELLQNNIALLEEQKAEFVSSLKESSNHSEAIEAENSKLHKMLEEVRRTSQCTCEQLVETEQRCKALEQQMEELKNADDALEKERSLFTEWQEDLRRQFDTVSEQLKEEVSKSSILAAEIAASKQQVNELLGQLAKQTGQVQESAQQLVERDEELKVKRQQLEELRSQLDSEHAEQQRLCMEMLCLNERLDSSSSTHTAELSALQDRYDDSQQMVEAQAEQLKRLEEQCHLASEELSEEKNVHRCLEEKLTTLRDARVRQLAQLEEETAKVHSLSKSFEEEQAFRRKLEVDFQEFHKVTSQQLAAKEETISELEKTIRERAAENGRLIQQLCSMESDQALLRQSLCEARQFKDSLQEDYEGKLHGAAQLTEQWEEQFRQKELHLEQLKEQTERVKQELSRRLLENEKQRVQLQASWEEERMQLEEELQETKEQVIMAQTERDQAVELAASTQKIQDELFALQERCQPFREQLEAFELERRMMQSETTMAKNEMAELSRRYGQLLGHQNQKQKIQHIVKIKEENRQLKEDVVKYRERCDQQRKTIRQLEEQLSFRRDSVRVPCTPFGTRLGNTGGQSTGSILGSTSETAKSKRLTRRRPADGENTTDLMAPSQLF